jgi:hypothetical protein
MERLLTRGLRAALDEPDKLNIGTAKERLREALYHTEEVYISQREDDPGDSPESLEK